MQNAETITTLLSSYIAEVILKQPKRKLAVDEALITSGLVDSFSLVDLAAYIEEALGVHIDDTELNAETFNTLAELTALIQSRLES